MGIRWRSLYGVDKSWDRRGERGAGGGGGGDHNIPRVDIAFAESVDGRVELGTEADVDVADKRL